MAMRTWDPHAVQTRYGEAIVIDGQEPGQYDVSLAEGVIVRDVPMDARVVVRTQQITALMEAFRKGGERKLALETQAFEEKVERAARAVYEAMATPMSDPWEASTMESTRKWFRRTETIALRAAGVT